MAEQAVIIIKRGAQLIVDGGVITSSGKTWQGIKIKGNKMQHVFGAQGKVILQNGGIIKNNPE